MLYFDRSIVQTVSWLLLELFFLCETSCLNTLGPCMRMNNDSVVVRIVFLGVQSVVATLKKGHGLDSLSVYKILFAHAVCA